MTTQERNDFLEALKKDKLIFKRDTMFFLIPWFLISLAFDGLMIGIGSVIPMNPIAILFPTAIVLGVAISIIRVILS